MAHHHIFENKSQQPKFNIYDILLPLFSFSGHLPQNILNSTHKTPN
jgi:hypothetical protein